MSITTALPATICRNGFYRVHYVANGVKFSAHIRLHFLLNRLLDLRTTADTALRDRIVALDAEITALETEIYTAEREMNSLVYTLYKLLPDEINLVESSQYK